MREHEVHGHIDSWDSEGGLKREEAERRRYYMELAEKRKRERTEAIELYDRIFAGLKENATDGAVTDSGN